MSHIELLRKAREKKDIDVKFDIVYGDVTIPAKLAITDLFKILEEQDIQYQRKYNLYQDEGWEERQINQADWEETLSKLDKKTKRSLTKPKNLADQKAQRFTQLYTVKELIPQFLKDPKTNQALFPSDAEQKEFQDYICSDMDLFNLLLSKFVEAMNKINKVEETVKNSKKQES